MSETFEEWYDDFFKTDPHDGYNFSSLSAWNHQQKKIDKLQEQNKKLRKCVELAALIRHPEDKAFSVPIACDVWEMAQQYLKELRDE